MDLLTILIICVLSVIFIIAIVVLSVFVVRYEKKHCPKIGYEQIPTPKVEYYNAKVLTKEIKQYFQPDTIHLPKNILEFLVEFEISNGVKYKFSLTKEIYDKLEEGQESTLVLLNGEFFDFGEGEDIID